MALTLYYHPLSSFCQKVLIALYENDTVFTPKLVDLMDAGERDAFLKLWPIGKFPLLHDDGSDRLIPESTIIIEYLDRHYPGRTRFMPADPEAAHEVRLADRFYDLYVHEPMQKHIADRLRPADAKDPAGVAQAAARMRTAYGILDARMATRRWAGGDAFGLADCAAAPALFYADRVIPFETYRNLKSYYERLLARPSFARCVAEAKPYFHMFPAQ